MLCESLLWLAWASALAFTAAFMYMLRCCCPCVLADMPVQLTAVLCAALALAVWVAWQLWFKPRVYLLDFVAKRPPDRCGATGARCRLFVRGSDSEHSTALQQPPVEQHGHLQQALRWVYAAQLCTCNQNQFWLRQP